VRERLVRTRAGAVAPVTGRGPGVFGGQAHVARLRQARLPPLPLDKLGGLARPREKDPPFQKRRVRSRAGCGCPDGKRHGWEHLVDRVA
jgi:hypothetical protein